MSVPIQMRLLGRSHTTLTVRSPFIGKPNVEFQEAPPFAVRRTRPCTSSTAYPFSAVRDEMSETWRVPAPLSAQVRPPSVVRRMEASRGGEDSVFDEAYHPLFRSKKCSVLSIGNRA